MEGRGGEGKGGQGREGEVKGREGDWCPPHDLFARRPCTTSIVSMEQ